LVSGSLSFVLSRKTASQKGRKPETKGQIDRGLYFRLARKPEVWHRYFMKTFVIANQKGGSGKSTLTVHLAAAAERAGDGPVLLSDTDPQGSTGDWFNQRKRAGINTPLYAPLALNDLKANVADLKRAGGQYLFIDTAPSIGGVNEALFAVADLIVIPLNPTPADLRALVKGLPAIKRSGKPFCFTLTRVRSNLRNNESAAMALEALGLVLPARMHERVIYAETFAHGKTAQEIDSSGTAAQEVAALWQAVKARNLESQKAREQEREPA
jgi:chromosome partitioning protein